MLKKVWGVGRGRNVLEKQRKCVGEKQMKMKFINWQLNKSREFTR